MISPSRLAAVCIRRRFLATTATPKPRIAPGFVPDIDIDPVDPAKSRNQKERTWIRLNNLPRTISPADVVRHIVSLTSKEPDRVHLDYRNFTPSGVAWVEFDSAEATENTITVLNSSTLAGHTLWAYMTNEQNLINAGYPPRTRGPKGRAEAQERGLMNGHGPDAKLRERGNNVHLWGLPGTMLAPELTKLFDPYGLRVTTEEPQPVQKVERKSPTSRFLVRLSSPAGAHRLVRDFHMTEKFGAGYLVHAKVIY